VARRHRGNGKVIQDTRWTGGNIIFAALSAGSSAQTILTSSNTIPETWMRMRGHLLAYLDGAKAGGEGVDVAIGAIVMPEGQGATVVSSPITDDTAPWLWYERFSLVYEEYVTDVVDAVGGPLVRIPIDAKAMRIIRPDREVQLVIEQATLSGLAAASVNVSLTSRILLGQK